MTERSGHLRVLALLVVGAALILCLPGEAQKNDVCFGHQVPDFREVFIKLFRASVTEMSMDQLKTASAQLSEKERAAISYYLGSEGHDRVLEGLPADKQAFLDEKYTVHTGVAPDYDFNKLYPHILAVSNNNLEPEQMKRTLETLTAEDIASQSFFLGEEGRAELFSEMTLDRVEMILDRTEDWVILETGRRKYAGISDYTCIVFKQERLDGKLQDIEKMLMKYRDKPLGIYAKWIDGPWKGREALYSENLVGTGKVRVRESGILGVIPVTLPVDAELAKRGSNHMLTELGLKYLIGMIEFDYRKAASRGDVTRINHGIVDYDGRKVYKMESVLPRDKSKGYYCYRLVHYIDFIRSLEIRAEMYTWDDQLYETYYYTQIKLNQGLTDKDFDPENPDYDL